MTVFTLTTSQGEEDFVPLAQVRRSIRNTATFWLVFGWGLGMLLGELHARGLL